MLKEFVIKINQKKILTAVILALIIGNIFFGVKYFLQLKTMQKSETELNIQKVNVGVVNFLNLFIEKVLQSNTEVSFEDRLKLENAVRDLNDKDLLVKWEQFTNATTTDQVQQAAKDLLQALVKKISVRK